MLSFLYSLLEGVFVVRRAALILANVTSRRVFRCYRLTTTIMRRRNRLAGRCRTLRLLLLAASYAGRVLRVMILMVSALLLIRRRQRCLLLIDVSAADHLVVATLLRLTRCSHQVRSIIRSHLPHIVRISVTHVMISITVVIVLATILPTNYHRCYRPLLDRSRSSIFRHHLWRVDDAYRLCLLSLCASHCYGCCAWSSSCRYAAISLLLGASGY